MGFMDRTEPSQQPERASFHLFTPPADSAARGDGAAPATAVGVVASGPPQPLTASAAPPPPSLTPRAGLHAPPSMPAASEVADPRAAFLARTSALHRQFAPDNGQLPGRALSNKVVPLQG